MTIYKLKENKSDPTLYEVIMSGELRSGKDIESDEFANVIKKIRKEAESKIVILDITDLEYWDSEGMRKILIPIREINKLHNNRAVIIGPKDSKNFDRAKEKYEVGGDFIPWFDTKKLFMDSLS